MSAATAEKDVNGPGPDLKRVMGPGLLLLFIVGDILGAGVTPSPVASPARWAASPGCRSWSPSASRR